MTSYEVRKQKKHKSYSENWLKIKESSILLNQKFLFFSKDKIRYTRNKSSSCIIDICCSFFDPFSLMHCLCSLKLPAFFTPNTGYRDSHFQKVYSWLETKFCFVNFLQVRLLIRNLIASLLKSLNLAPTTFPFSFKGVIIESLTIRML